MKFIFQQSKKSRGGEPTKVDPKGPRCEIRSRSLNEAWLKLEQSGPLPKEGTTWIHIKPRELDLESQLAEAIALLQGGLSLRMHGDIEHQPMSQAEWDSRTEEFLRKAWGDA